MFTMQVVTESEVNGDLQIVSVEHLRFSSPSGLVTWDCEWQQLMQLPSGVQPPTPTPAPASFLNKP